MKYLILIAALASCKVLRDSRELAAESLGPDAVCSWRHGGPSTEILCLRGGRRYVCLVNSRRDTVQCSLLTTSPTEMQ